MTHGAFIFARESLLVLLVAADEEDGIIHRNGQLQDSRDCFCNVGDLTENHVRAHVVHDGEGDINQKKERNREGVGQQKHRDQ